jgi:hypothetical protein
MGYSTGTVGSQRYSGPAPEAVLSNPVEHNNRSAIAAAAAIVIGALLTVLPGGPAARDVRAAASVNLDQWATKDVAWQNGNLNGNNTQYPEGGIVPFRLAVEGLVAGNHTIRIQYDFTAGGHKAYDFLARWNGWVSPPICSASGGGISSMCPSMPAPSSMAFPSDSFVTDGLSVAGAEAYSGVSRRLTIWGGTIVSIGGPAHAGSTAGNSTAEFTVHFRSTGSAVLLAWGGHLAQSRYWNLLAGGTRDGAGEVSGAPWHMRTLQLDGSGNRNQDRSIQPSAIVGELPPFYLAPSPPTPTPKPPTNRGIATPRPTVPPGNAVATDPVGGGPLPTPPQTWSAADPSPVEVDRTTGSVALGVLGVLIAGALAGAWRFRTPRRDRPRSNR